MELERCPSCGSYLKANWVVILVSCSCGHGGRAWHDKVLGKCTYGNCNCLNLKPIEAYVHPKGYPDKFKCITGKDFIKLYDQSKENIIFV